MLLNLPIAVVTSIKAVSHGGLRQGFSTGTAAAAAAVIAYLKKTGEKLPETIDVLLPKGIFYAVPVSMRDGIAGVVKDSGDDPDVTNGIFVYAEIEFAETPDIQIEGGVGVGVATREGLSVRVGEAAINPVPRNMIAANLRRFMQAGGAKVTIHAPDGERAAEKTFNSRLGIVGGISILGTEGIVSPMSKDALISTIRCEINVLAAEKADFIWLVPGKIGERALKAARPDAHVVQMSNYAGEAFSALVDKGYRCAGVAGHPGKLAKLAMGAKNTHSKESPQANEYIYRLFKLDQHVNSLEALCTAEWRSCHNLLAAEISRKVCEMYGFEKVSVLLFSMNGTEVGVYE